MNAPTEPAGSAQVAGDCLDIEGSRVCAELTEDGVLVVRIRLADGGTTVAVYIGETLVAGNGADVRAVGRHHRRDA